MPAEFDCTDCGVHVVDVIATEPPAVKTCATCTRLPGWKYHPELRAVFGTGVLEPTQWPDKMPPALREVLGLMVTDTWHIANALRTAGMQIASKTEDEQAHVLFWLVGLALRYGDDWRTHAVTAMRQIIAIYKGPKADG